MQTLTQASTVYDVNSKKGYPHNLSQINREALEWFTRLLNDPSDSATKTAFEAWCVQNADNLGAYRKIQRFWHSEAFSVAISETYAYTENVTPN